MSISSLAGPTRRFLLNRLERLRESLESLGHRLRECIAEIVGKQMGEAIRDALDDTLRMKSLSPSSDGDRHETRRVSPQEDARRWQWEGNEPDDPSWEADEPYYERAHEPTYQDRTEPATVQPSEPRPSRWRSLLTGLVELAGWWFPRGPQRPSFRKLLGLGAVVGAVTAVAGPVAGGIAMTISTALLLTSSASAQSLHPGTVPATVR
jgi:hypothetical protein